MSDDVAVARLAASWLLWYPDAQLRDRVGEIRAAVVGLPAETREPLTRFLDYLDGTATEVVQAHYVELFDMRRRACPYLTYWTDGSTRNRGRAILKFKQAYLEAGALPNDSELADHLAVVLEFAAVGDRVTGEALLAEFSGPINLLHEALAGFETPYADVLAAVVATLPELTDEVAARMAELAASGPPAEQVGLEPFSTNPALITLGARR